MTTNTAVKKLNTDISRYQKAQKAETKAASAEKKAQASIKTDTAAEKKALATIDTQKQAILDQFSSASTPPDNVAAQQLLNQMYALGQKEVQTQDAFGKKLSTDKSNVKKDAKAVTHDKKAVKADHQKALKDLKPAEYHLSLKATNHDRKALGLKSVNKVIRPADKGGKTIEDAKKYLGKDEATLQREGVTRPCPYGESCANFVSSMLTKSGAANYRTLGVKDLSNHLIAAGWHKVPLKDAKPGDVWITSYAKGAPSEEHTELVASNKNGHVTLIGSNNISSSMQKISYDSSSAYIEGSYILAPPNK